MERDKKQAGVGEREKQIKAHAVRDFTFFPANLENLILNKF
jgi:hypothetical protein